MTRPRALARRAPGKLFVAGEFAVVEPGTPAILVAVDRYVTVTVAAADQAGVLISSDLSPAPARWAWHGARLSACGSAGEPRASGGLPHVVAAVEVTGRLLTERGLPVPALSVSISSGLHEDGTKLGLGSSGAVTVATVEAVAAFCGLDLSPGSRFRLAMLATAGIDATASGGDLAASSWGGWIAYQAPDRAAVLDLARRRGVAGAVRLPWPGFAVRRLAPPDGLSLAVGWTGVPASSAALVSRLYRRDSGSLRRFAAATADCVRTSISALDRGDRHALLEQIRRARQELARLDDETGLGIFTSKLTALCEAAEAAGGAAKPSGAGGGDCGIALFDTKASPDIAGVHKRWAIAGVRPLPIRPAPERNEE